MDEPDTQQELHIMGTPQEVVEISGVLGEDIFTAIRQEYGEAGSSRNLIKLTIKHGEDPEALKTAFEEAGHHAGNAEQDWPMQIGDDEAVLSKGSTFVVARETLTL